MSKILWIDDNDSTTALVGEKLEDQHEVTVMPYLTGSSRVHPRDFDLIVLDLFIERDDNEGHHRDNGLSYLVDLMRRDRGLKRSVESGSVRWLLLSQHLAEYELREFIRDFNERYDIRAFLRSKNEEVPAAASRRDAIADIIQGVLREPSSPRLADEVKRLSIPPSPSISSPLHSRSFGDWPILSKPNSKKRPLIRPRRPPTRLRGARGRGLGNLHG